MSLAGRTLRRIGLDRNPLRRTIDRVEAWITIVIMVAFALIVPATTWLTGRAAYGAGVHTEQVERAHRYRTQAVLLADAGSDSVVDAPPPHQGAAPARTGNTTTGVRTPARWTSPDGGAHRGSVLADERARAGQWVPVWTDADGDLTDPPQQRVQTVVNAIAAAILAGVGAACLAGAVRLLVRRTLDARRMAQWEAAWWQFEPRWTGRS
jgi:multisubunit Na+/H+ antiporter MnhB subunit